MSDKFKKFTKKQVSEMRPYEKGESMEGISVAEVDYKNGSPKEGDMIARNPNNHDDQWLVAARYFDENFSAAE